VSGVSQLVWPLRLVTILVVTAWLTSNDLLAQDSLAVVLDREAENLTKLGFGRAVHKAIEQVDHDRKKFLPIQLEGGRENAIIVACDNACDRVDAVLFDYQSNPVATGPENSGIVILNGVPSYTGLHQLEVSVPSCTTPQCSVGMMVLRKAGPPQGSPSSGQDSTNENVRRDYELTTRIGTRAALEAFLVAHPQGLYSDLARAELAKLTPSPPDQKDETTPAKKSSPEKKQEAKKEGAKSGQFDFCLRSCKAEWLALASGACQGAACGRMAEQACRAALRASGGNCQRYTGAR
jgi:hypothetical protein